MRILRTNKASRGLDKDFLFDGLMPKEIWVNEFTEESAQLFREQVIAATMEGTTKPITIYIDSYGGSVDALSKMIETMNEFPNQFITVVMGKAMSAGAILLSHGDIRFCGPHSRIMIHEVLSYVGGNVHDMHADAAEVMRLNKHFIGLMAQNCGIKDGYDGLRALIKEKDERDLYLDANEALKFGIVDFVGIPKVMPSLAHEIVLLPEKKREPVETKYIDDIMEEIAKEAVAAPIKVEEKPQGKTKPKRQSKKKK
jgi:ATP-dependent Clp protease, protease subunit